MRIISRNIVWPVIALLPLVLSACCLTRAQDRFGIKDVSAMDLRKAVLYNGTDLYLETTSSVRWGRNNAGYPGVDTIKMKCSFAARPEAIFDVSDEVKERSYLNGKGNVHWFFTQAAEIDRVTYVKDTSCSEIDNDTVLAGEIVEIVTGEDRFAGKTPRTPFIYIEGAHQYYPTRNFLVLGNNRKYTYMPIYYVPTKRVETAGRHFKFLVYPVTLALDFLTFPFQVLTFDHHGCFGGCPRWTCNSN